MKDKNGQSSCLALVRVRTTVGGQREQANWPTQDNTPKLKVIGSKKAMQSIGALLERGDFWSCLLNYNILPR